MDMNEFAQVMTTQLGCQPSGPDQGHRFTGTYKNHPFVAFWIIMPFPYRVEWQVHMTFERTTKTDLFKSVKKRLKGIAKPSSVANHDNLNSFGVHIKSKDAEFVNEFNATVEAMVAAAAELGYQVQPLSPKF